MREMQRKGRRKENGKEMKGKRVERERERTRARRAWMRQERGERRRKRLVLGGNAGKRRTFSKTKTVEEKKDAKTGLGKSAKRTKKEGRNERKDITQTLGWTHETLSEITKGKERKKERKICGHRCLCVATNAVCIEAALRPGLEMPSFFNPIAETIEVDGRWWKEEKKERKTRRQKTEGQEIESRGPKGKGT